MTLLRYVFELIIAWIAWRFIARALQQVFSARPDAASDPKVYTNPATSKRPTVTGEMVRDPVCGMFVSTEITHRLREHGQMLHFCSRECLEQYQKQALGHRGEGTGTSG